MQEYELKTGRTILVDPIELLFMSDEEFYLWELEQDAKGFTYEVTYDEEE